MAVAVDMRGRRLARTLSPTKSFSVRMPRIASFPLPETTLSFTRPFCMKNKDSAASPWTKIVAFFLKVTNCLPTPAVERNTWGACLPVSIFICGSILVLPPDEYLRDGCMIYPPTNKRAALSRHAQVKRNCKSEQSGALRRALRENPVPKRTRGKIFLPVLGPGRGKNTVNTLVLRKTAGRKYSTNLI